MDTVCLPSFLKNNHEVQMLRHLEVFANLSTRFTSGVDTSVTTMKTLLQHPPVEGLPIMNGALDILKDIVFAYQATRQTGSGQDACLQIPPSQQEKTTEFKLFPRQQKPILNTLYKSLKAAIAEHKAVVRKLRDAQQGYQKHYNYLQQLVHRYKTRHPAQTTPQVNKMTHRLELGTTQNPDKKLDKLQKQMKKQNDMTVKALVRLIVFKQRERQLRDDKLKQTERKLRDMVQNRIADALKSGINNLAEFGRRVSLSQSMMDRVDQFDVQYAASQIYKNISTRYVYPAIEGYVYVTGLTLPSCRFETPDLRVQDKQDIRHASYLDCVQETYVRACQDSDSKMTGAALHFAIDQKIKQKSCSSDGQLAFGWTRMIPGCSKTYGFYPTHSVYLAP